MKFILFLFLILPSIVNAATSWSTGAYTNNQDISKVLLIEGATSIKVKVTGKTEECCDVVYIYNTQSNELIKTLKGDINETFVVNSNSIKVRLKSDHSITYAGITASVSLNNNAVKPSITDIPDIMRKKGWDFAAKLMDRWFEGKGGIYYTDLSILKNKYPIIGDAYNDYSNDAYNSTLYVDNTMLDPLIKSLKNLDNEYGGKVIPDGGTFIFIDNEISNAGNKWKTSIYEDEIKNMNWFGEKTLFHLKLDEYTAAFNNSALRIVPNGEVVVNSNGSLSINILELGIYLRDGYDFNFPEDGEDDQELACWSFKSPYVAHPYLKWTLTDPLCVSNKSFRDYNTNNGNDVHHGNYRIFSTIEKSHRFYTNLSFDYIPEPEISGNKAIKYIDKCINKFSSYFGSKIGDTYTCRDSNNNEYFCQETDGKITLIAVSKELIGNQFWYYWSGWNKLGLSNCE